MDVSKLSAKFDSVAITDVHDAVVLSSFETLPVELVLAIFEYVPEAICSLRLTSRTVQRRVDEFLRQHTTIPLVRHISISDSCNRADRSESESDTLWLRLDVPARMAALFELRLKFRSPILRARMTRWDGRARVSQINYYHLEISVANTADWDSLFTSIRGSSVKKVFLTNNRDDTDLPTVCKHLGQVRFEELTLDISEFSQAKIDAVLEVLEVQNVESLSLTLYVVTASTENFLLEIASRVRALHIHGDYVFMATNHHVQWAQLVIEMFSRRLDMLDLADHDLSRADADLLINRLPQLGKKIWFKGTFTQNIIGRSNKINGHVIHETCPIWRPNKPPKERALSIIHKSRLNEVSP